MSPTPLFDEFTRTSLYIDKTIKHLFGLQYIDYLKKWYPPVDTVKPDPTTGRLPRIVQKPEPHTTDRTQDWFLRSLDSYPYPLLESGLRFSETRLSQIVHRSSSLPDCELIEAELKTAVNSCTQPDQIKPLRAKIESTHNLIEEMVGFLLEMEVSKTTSEMSGQYRHDIDLLIDEERSQQKVVWDEQKTYTLTKLKRYSLQPFAQWIDQKTEYLTKLKRASDYIHAINLLPGKIGFYEQTLCRIIDTIDQSVEPLTIDNDITVSSAFTKRQRILKHFYEGGNMVKRKDKDYNDYIQYCTNKKRLAYPDDSQSKLKALIEDIGKVALHLSGKFRQDADRELNILKGRLTVEK